jgi:hypothetical protein
MSELSTIGKIIKALELAKVAQTGVELTYFDAIELLGYLKILEEINGLLEEERDTLYTQLKKENEVLRAELSALKAKEQASWLPAESV